MNLVGWWWFRFKRDLAETPQWPGLYVGFQPPIGTPTAVGFSQQQSVGIILTTAPAGGGLIHCQGYDQVVRTHPTAGDSTRSEYEVSLCSARDA
jgi:hypothetical protein